MYTKVRDFKISEITTERAIDKSTFIYTNLQIATIWANLIKLISPIPYILDSVLTVVGCCNHACAYATGRS